MNGRPLSFLHDQGRWLGLEVKRTAAVTAHSRGSTPRQTEVLKRRRYTRSLGKKGKGLKANQKGNKYPWSCSLLKEVGMIWKIILGCAIVFLLVDLDLILPYH
jgi:hypothetical protein